MSCFFPSRQQSLFENSFPRRGLQWKKCKQHKDIEESYLLPGSNQLWKLNKSAEPKEVAKHWLSWVDTLRTPTPLNVAFFARTQGQCTERSSLAWRGQIATSAEQSWKKGCAGGFCRLNFGRVSLEVSLELTDLENLRWQSVASR